MQNKTSPQGDRCGILETEPAGTPFDPELDLDGIKLEAPWRAVDIEFIERFDDGIRPKPTAMLMATMTLAERDVFMAEQINADNNLRERLETWTPPPTPTVGLTVKALLGGDICPDWLERELTRELSSDFFGEFIAAGTLLRFAGKVIECRDAGRLRARLKRLVNSDKRVVDLTAVIGDYKSQLERLRNHVRGLFAGVTNEEWRDATRSLTIMAEHLFATHEDFSCVDSHFAELLIHEREEIESFVELLRLFNRFDENAKDMLSELDDHVFRAHVINKAWNNDDGAALAAAVPMAALAKSVMETDTLERLHAVACADPLCPWTFGIL